MSLLKETIATLVVPDNPLAPNNANTLMPNNFELKEAFCTITLNSDKHRNTDRNARFGCLLAQSVRCHQTRITCSPFVHLF